MTNEQIEKAYKEKDWPEARRMRNRVKAGKLPRWTREKQKVGVKRKSDGKLKAVQAEIWYDTIKIFVDAYAQG